MAGCEYNKHSAPLEPGGGWRAADTTNIRLRWSQERDGGLRTLQTFGSSGAGREGCGHNKHSAPLEPGGRAADTTNIRLLWSREGDGGLRTPQTFGSAGARSGMEGCGYYKHSASKKAVAFFREKTPGESNLAPLELGGHKNA